MRICDNTADVPLSDLPVIMALYNRTVRMKVRLQPTEFVGGTMKAGQLTAIIEREGDGYVALCPELDIASQGETVAVARANLIEALDLFFETASDAEVGSRLNDGPPVLY